MRVQLGPRTNRKAGWVHQRLDVILGTSGILIVVLFWQLMSSLHWVNPLILSSPLQIVHSFAQQLENGTLNSDILITIIEMLTSYISAILVGVLLGLAMGWFRFVEYTADFFVWFLYSTPLIALYPLLVIWFGVGVKIAVILGFVLAFVPIAINTYTGIKEVDSILIRASLSFGAHSFQILQKVAFPSALPMIMAGCRLGVERALIGVVIGEMFSSNVGLGFRISYYGSLIQTSNLFVSLILIILFGLVLTQIIRLLESRVLKWND